MVIREGLVYWLVISTPELRFDWGRDEGDRYGWVLGEEGREGEGMGTVAWGEYGCVDK